MPDSCCSVRGCCSEDFCCQWNADYCLYNEMCFRFPWRDGFKELFVRMMGHLDELYKQTWIVENF